MQLIAPLHWSGTGCFLFPVPLGGERRKVHPSLPDTCGKHSLIFSNRDLLLTRSGPYRRKLVRSYPFVRVHVQTAAGESQDRGGDVGDGNQQTDVTLFSFFLCSFPRAEPSTAKASTLVPGRGSMREKDATVGISFPRSKTRLIIIHGSHAP